jgi:RND superfamily putative drug exporter
MALVSPPFDARAQDDEIRFIPERFTSVRAYQLLSQAFPKDVFASRIVFALERADGPLTEADFALVQELAKDLEQLRHEAPDLKLGSVDSFQDGIVGTRMTSTDRQCTLVQMSLDTTFLAYATVTAVDRAEQVAQERLARSGIRGLQIFTTGVAGIGRDMTRACASGLDSTTWATFGLVVVVLLIVYRAPLLALVPLVTIGMSVWVALNGLALMSMLPGVHLVNISKVFAVVILYGAGTDYCLFLISRYREELQSGQRVRSAVARGVGGVGEALAASAGTVMVGLGLMACAEFAKVRYCGPAIAMSLGVALVASLTLTPALLRLLGKHVFWPAKPPAPISLQLRVAHPRRRGLWDWVSHAVARHPRPIWCAAAGLLLPLVIVGLCVYPDYRATGELSPDTQSLKGLAAIQRHFTAGEVGPVTVLLAADEDWSSFDGRAMIRHLSRGFSRLPNVAEVRSLTQPLGMALPELQTSPNGHGILHMLIQFLQPLLDDLHQEIDQTAREHYVGRIQGSDGGHRYVTRLDVVLHSEPFAPASAETLAAIQTWLREDLPRYRYLKGPVQAECCGITANTQDLAAVTESDRCRVNSLVLGAILVILLVLVRRLWMALYLLVTVLASYYAALGATALVSILWTGNPTLALDWRVPFFLFTILVAVGEDYNILLMSRALEERKRHGGVEGMRRALSRTGGAITSCGLIMAGTFATLMLCGLQTLMQTGFALAFGVLIDTFLVRPFLVPACAMVFWRTPPSPVEEPRLAEPAYAADTWRQAA